MKRILHLKSISDLYKLFNLGHSHHPLVAVLDFSKVNEHSNGKTKFITDFYSIMFKNYCKNTLKYGRKHIDFQDGSLICIAPNQVIEADEEIVVKENMIGWGIFFHPDLIRSSTLGSTIKNYNFFYYEISESLHLSEKEKCILLECIQKIESELKENIDTYSQQIIISYIELLLNYCSRFYGRQLITRNQTNKTIVSQIEKIILSHFSNLHSNEDGLLSVKYLADQVHLSPSYLSDLLKKETGRNAQEHIHYYLLEEAKNRLIHSESTISEIAYDLGFEYPQYFNKLFKQKTGKTPLEFRNLN